LDVVVVFVVVVVVLGATVVVVFFAATAACFCFIVKSVEPIPPTNPEHNTCSYVTDMYLLLKITFVTNTINKDYCFTTIKK